MAWSTHESATDQEADDDARVNLANANISGFSHYLHDQSTDSNCEGPSANFAIYDQHDWWDVPTSDAFNNAYVQIVHSNGIHHLALMYCQCYGADSLLFDLLACKLWKNLNIVFIPAAELFLTMQSQTEGIGIPLLSIDLLID